MDRNYGGDMYIPYLIEKVENSPSPYPYPYPYPYPVNERILRKNGNEFAQYPRGWVYLSSLLTTQLEILILYEIFLANLLKKIAKKVFFSAI